MYYLFDLCTLPYAPADKVLYKHLGNLCLSSRFSSPLVDYLLILKIDTSLPESPWLCPVVRTPCFYCKGPGFNPVQGNQDPHAGRCSQKKDILF